MILPFPKLNSRVYGLPSELQNLADLELSLKFLATVLPTALSPDKSKLPFGKTARPLYTQFLAIDLFRQLCYTVCQELADRDLHGSLVGYSERYNRVHVLCKQIIDLLEKDCGRTIDMSSLVGIDPHYDRYYPDNWYQLVYDELLLTERIFSRKLVDYQKSSSLSIATNQARSKSPARRLIALTYLLEGKQITETNKDVIAAANGLNAKTSGLQILRIYKKLESDSLEVKKAKDSYSREEMQRVKIL